MSRIAVLIESVPKPTLVVCSPVPMTSIFWLQLGALLFSVLSRSLNASCFNSGSSMPSSYLHEIITSVTCILGLSILQHLIGSICTTGLHIQLHSGRLPTETCSTITCSPCSLHLYNFCCCITTCYQMNSMLQGPCAANNRLQNNLCCA